MFFSKYKIYFLICPIDGLVRYVGITSVDLQKRLRNHLCDHRGNPHKTRWIQNLKSQNLRPQIKLVCGELTKQQACQQEVELISNMRFLVDKKLTNISLGGELGPGLAGRTHPFFGIKRPHHSVWMKENNPMHTDAAKQKISLLKKVENNKNFSSWNKKNKSKPVGRFTLNNEFIDSFPSVREASRQLGFKSSAIYSQLRGLSKTSNGFIWKYL